MADPSSSTSSVPAYSPSSYKGRRTRKSAKKQQQRHDAPQPLGIPQHPPEVVQSVKGVNGVRLKLFEKVVASLLSSTSDSRVAPLYFQLPPLPAAAASNKNASTNDESDLAATTTWPFGELPPAARVWGTLPGQLAQKVRATRKEEQVRSMLRCILPLLPPAPATSSILAAVEEEDPYTIVDFGGGSGHLSIPLALGRPDCRVICVDLGARSLDLLHQKAARCQSGDGVPENGKAAAPPSTKQHSPNGAPEQKPSFCLQSTAIPNLFTFHGATEAFTGAFHMAVALHLCGEATDVVLRLAGRNGNNKAPAAIVVAPCCVGKLSATSRNPYVYQATGQNAPTVEYPQSSRFCQLITEQYDWNALAKAADYSSDNSTTGGECRTSRNAARRTAKALLETDRRLFLEETYGYATALTRMEPWEATPKNDILVAWWRNSSTTASPIVDQVDTACQADIQRTIDHLIVNPDESSSETAVPLSSSAAAALGDAVDWTREEQDDIRQQLDAFLATTTHDEEALVFPTGMGGRKRKLVHFVAEQLGLAHWCVGSKHSEKTVAVRRRREPRQEQQNK